MRRRWAFKALFVLFVAAIAAAAHGEESISNEMVRLQAAYDTEVVKIRVDIERKQETLFLQYGKSLDALEQGAQKAGLLDKLLAARKEKERFASSRQLEESDYRRQCTRQQRWLVLAAVC